MGVTWHLSRLVRSLVSGHPLVECTQNASQVKTKKIPFKWSDQDHEIICTRCLAPDGTMAQWLENITLFRQTNQCIQHLHDNNKDHWRQRHPTSCMADPPPSPSV
jgi:hypothetical protein